VGYRIVQQLYRLTPRPNITVIDRGDAKRNFSSYLSELDGVKLVVGDARELKTLRKADVHLATTVIAATPDDLNNLLIGLTARQIQPQVRLVLRVFSNTLAEKMDDLFHIPTIFSTSELASPTLAAAAILSGISNAFFVGNKLLAVDLHTFSKNDRLAGKTIRTIRAQEGVLVIATHREGRTLALPPLDTVIAAGDEVTLLAELPTLARLRAY
jgi:Trk K+ transport system NAD-binding subunit